MRDNSIDIAKGIGIILVVWGHQFANCPIFNWIHLFHMPLFFFLGGCFMKDEKYSVFLYKKIRTLFIPFLFFYTSSLLLKFVIYRMREGDFSFIYDIYFYSISSVNYPLWFIVCLFISINMYYFIRRFKYELWAILFATFVGATLYYFQIRLPFFISQAFLATAFLYLGEKVYKRNVDNKMLLFIVLLTIPFFIYAGIKDVKVDMAALIINSNFLLFLLPAICGIGLTLLVSRLICSAKYSFILQRLGRYSLFIFALHINTGFLKPISKAAIEITSSFILLNNIDILIGIVDTIIAILFSFVIGLILNKYFSIFFGYKSNDRIISKLQSK